MKKKLWVLSVLVFDKTSSDFSCNVDKNQTPLSKSPANATPYVFGGSLYLPFVSSFLFSGRSYHPSHRGQSCRNSCRSRRRRSYRSRRPGW